MALLNGAHAGKTRSRANLRGTRFPSPSLFSSSRLLPLFPPRASPRWDLLSLPRIPNRVRLHPHLFFSLLFNLAEGRLSAKWRHFSFSPIGFHPCVLSAALAASKSPIHHPSKPNPSLQRPSRPCLRLSLPPIAHHDSVVTTWLGREGHSQT